MSRNHPHMKTPIGTVTLKGILGAEMHKDLLLDFRQPKKINFDESCNWKQQSPLTVLPVKQDKTFQAKNAKEFLIVWNQIESLYCQRDYSFTCTLAEFYICTYMWLSWHFSNAKNFAKPTVGLFSIWGQNFYLLVEYCLKFYGKGSPLTLDIKFVTDVLANA